MIPTMEIVKIQSGVYEVTLEAGGQPITATEVHESISSAILSVGTNVPDDWTKFVEIRYSGISIGTVSTARMVTQWEELATELVGLYATVAKAEEEMAFAESQKTT